ncbi:MAG: barstar family protein [Clostridia bacterium]|nr:barstar family protein [Clostridia bacterium]
MEEKKTIILDLTGCKYLGELHERIRVAFDFPEWYGANLSAFDDLLWTECDAEELIIIGEKTLPNEFERVISQIHRILDKKVEQTKEDHSLYDDIKLFSYIIES